MSTGKPDGTETFDWYVEPDRPDAALPRHRAGDERAHSLALAITTALLFVLVAGAFMFGGHAAVAPLLHRDGALPETEGTGEIVYAMPDSTFCRRMAFDNVTAEITSAAVGNCPASIGSSGPPSSGRFEWGNR